MRFKEYLTRVVEWGYRPEDDTEMRRKKAALTLVPLIIGPAAFIWGSLYFYLDKPLSGSIPMSYSIVSAITLAFYFRSKQTGFLETSQLLLVLLLPFFLMWSLGGFFHGSTVMIWALFAPVAAVIFMERSHAFWWFAAYFVLLLVSVGLQGYLSTTITPIPELFRVIFFVLNLGAGSAGLYLLVGYTNNQAKNAIAGLYQNQLALEQYSEGLQLANEQLAAARRDAEAASQAKSEFLANMSHEIRTPMNAVINLSRLALQGPLDDTQHDYIQKVYRSGSNLLGIINDILDFSKIEAGKLSLEKEDFSLRETLNDIITLVSSEAVKKGLRLDYYVPPDLHPWYTGDALRIAQILTNLLNNAVKFTETGTVKLSVTPTAQDDDTTTLHFTVEDSGIGIAPEQQSRLFSPFEQADGSTTRRFGGTGLGLTICRQLLGLMGSELQLTSSPGQGSRFDFELTLPRAEASAQDTLPESAETLTTALASRRGAAVLLVEDNDINQMIAEELLGSVLGLELTIANNGAEALELLAPGRFELILMDLQMPVMDGHQATLKIRGDPAYDDLPIIAMTAHAMVEERNRCLAEGMNDHVTKPIIVEELFATLLRWLRPRPETL